MAIVLLEDVRPALLVEVARPHVVVEDLLGVGDLVRGDHRASEVALDEVLQAEEADLVELAATALKVLRAASRERAGASRSEQQSRRQQRWEQQQQRSQQQQQQQQQQQKQAGGGGRQGTGVATSARAVSAERAESGACTGTGACHRSVRRLHQMIVQRKMARLAAINRVGAWASRRAGGRWGTYRINILPYPADTACSG